MGAGVIVALFLIVEVRFENVRKCVSMCSIVAYGRFEKIDQENEKTKGEGRREEFISALTLTQKSHGH
jgi:hypothetical protein